MSDPDGFVLSQSKIAIIGLGLMGGSLAMALKGRCAAVYGIDSDRATLELARAQQVVDEAEADPGRLLRMADVVILAVPVLTILSLLEQLPSWVAQACIVFDLGSTKELIVESMARLPAHFDPIGGHPICGKEKLSLANAEPTLYYGAPFVLTPLGRTSARARSAAHQIIAAIGAQPAVLEAAEHDRILASTSHLPFLLSAALVLATAAEAAAYTGPGFRSASRLAGTPTSMMLGILRTNQWNVLGVLHCLRSKLSEMESALAAEDYSSLELLLDEAQSRYQGLTSR